MPAWQGELTLGVGADKGGEVGEEGEGGEVRQVGDLQGMQQGTQALGTKPGGRQKGSKQGSAEHRAPHLCGPTSCSCARVHTRPLNTKACGASRPRPTFTSLT